MDGGQGFAGRIGFEEIATTHFKKLGIIADFDTNLPISIF